MNACPQCGWSHSEDPASASAGMTKGLARVGSVAEAGYLVALLEEAGVSATARADESFSAVQGAWSQTYLVSVPESDQDLAVQLLQVESHDGFNEIAGRVFDNPDAHEPRALVNPWRMLTVLAVVAAAGALVAADTLGGGRAARVQRPGQADANGGANDGDRGAAPIGDLSAALRAADTPFRSESVEGGPRRMLRFLPQSRCWELLTDADRDGRYESRRRFVEPQVAPRAAAR